MILHPVRSTLLFALGVVAVSIVLTLCHYLGVASAAGTVMSDPVAVAAASAGDGWSLVTQYGPLWGGALLMFGLGGAVLKANASSHWLAQGRRLALVTGAMSALGAILEWRLNGGEPAGVLVTALMALKLALSPTAIAVPGAGAAASALVVLLVGALQPACSSPPGPSQVVLGIDPPPDRTCPVKVPPELAPAPDQDLAFALSAWGVQRYACAGSAAAGFAWAFVTPDADLFAAGISGLMVHHFSGPTWIARDTSLIVGAKIAAATVDATAIPWLLLSVSRHAGAVGALTAISSIQRLETGGGLAPLAVTCDADHVGAGADVPYRARYFFYHPSSDHPELNRRCGA